MVKLPKTTEETIKTQPNWLLGKLEQLGRLCICGNNRCLGGGWPGNYCKEYGRVNLGY